MERCPRFGNGKLMRQYKLYFLDKNDVVITARDFLGKNDLAALEEGKRLCLTHTIEIISGTRKVARIDRKKPPLRTKKPVASADPGRKTRRRAATVESHPGS